MKDLNSSYLVEKTHFTYIVTKIGITQNRLSFFYVEKFCYGN